MKCSLKESLPIPNMVYTTGPAQYALVCIDLSTGLHIIVPLLEVWEPGNLESHSGLHSELGKETAQYAFTLRRCLRKLTNWVGPVSTLSSAVADSIETVMNTLFDDTERTAFTWSLNVKVGNIEDSREKIHFRVIRNNELWKMDATHIEAALSL